MTIKRLRTMDSYPCERCGRIEDLTGEIPDGPLLCLECHGFFVCRCCELRYGEYEGRVEEYEGDPADYICPQCRDRCHYDAKGSGCRSPSSSNRECRCPSRPGPIPRRCPRCGACNHIDLDVRDRTADGGVPRCGDCGQGVSIRIIF